MLNLLFATLAPFAQPDYDFDPDQVTSGPIGFLVIAVLAVAVMLLIIPMVRTLRRISYREQVRAQLAEELAAGEQAATEAPLANHDKRD